MALVDTADAPNFHLTTKLEWGHALRALRQLLDDRDDTAQVFEVMRALNGSSTVDGYRRLLSSHDGGRLAYERAEFAQQLMDDMWLDSLPADSVGAAYRQFVRSEKLSADGLADVSRRGAAQEDDLHPYAWFGRRIRDVHDVWHILSGYGRDALGEASLVAFSYAQTKSLGWAVMALGAASRARKFKEQPYVKAIWEGYQRGKAAQWLPGEDYGRLMGENLENARRRLGITPATIYDAIPAEVRDNAVPKVA